MKAGKLDRTIDIQRRASGQSASGAPADDWSTIPRGARRAAGYRPLRGEERNTAPQWVALQQVEFTLRWAAALAGVNPKDRIVYPAIMLGLSPEDEVTEDRVYDIIEVHEMDRRDGLRIVAARKADGG